MRYEKHILDSIEKCYALSPLRREGEELLLVAGEKEAPCRIYRTDGSCVDQVWDSPGGVMTMVPVPDGSGDFLSTQAFFSPDESTEARLICARKGKDGWSLTKVRDIPWVHRFDLIPGNGVTHVIVCTLKSGHEYAGDFRAPGKLWTGILPEDPAQPLELSVFMEGLGRNHGYTRYTEDGKISCIVSCDQGVFRIHPPETERGAWTSEKLLGEAVSDAVLLDMDGDGTPELLTLSPFHGDTLRIWKRHNGVFEVVYEYPEKLPFLHAICGGLVYDRPMAFVGNREGERLLLGFYWDAASGCWACDELDRNAGSANCMLFRRDGHPALLVTNREIDEVAVYDIFPNA